MIETGAFFARDSLRNLHWVRAFLSVLPLAAILLLAQALSAERTELLVALGGCFSTGTGAGRRFLGRRWTMICLDLTGKFAGFMAGALAAGSLATLALGLEIAGAAVVSGMAVVHMSLWWVGMQSWIFFMLAATFAAHLGAPLHLALIIVGAGLLQILFSDGLFALWRWLRPVDTPQPTKDEEKVPTIDLRAGAAGLLQGGFAVAGAHMIASAVVTQNAYWAPLTTLIVSRKGFGVTWRNGLERVIVTILGCICATLLALAADNNHSALIPLFLITAFLAYAVLGINFTVFAGLLSATTVFMVSMSHGSVLVNAEHRIIATAIGGAVAAVVAGALLLLRITRD